jgi:V8-like Glu-specific endopeptidase
MTKLALALLPALAAAQVVFESGKPLMVKSTSIFQMPSFNSSAVAFHSEKTKFEKISGFAIPTQVSINANKDGSWSGNTWTITLEAADTVKGMYVAFDGFKLPEGAKLFMYNEAGEVAGPFTAANNKANGEFSIWPMQGQKITIEYDGLTATTKPVLSIDLVGQAYAPFPGYTKESRGPSGWCNVNTACSDADDWRDEVDAVAILMSSFGGGYCSGSMINNKDGKQLFLTAYHCSPGSRDQVGFNFQEDTCNGNDNSISKDSASGLTSIGSNRGSDYHLLEVDEAIPSSYGVYLAGWNAEDVTSYSDEVTCISHPSADRKKFTQHYDSTAVTRSGYITSNGQTHWYVKSWELGTTEGGSSGSPLFNKNKQIIGQLHGGYASCTYNVDDYYGALAASWTGSDGAALYNALSGSSSTQSMSGARL